MPQYKDHSFRQALPWTAFVALMFTLNYMARTALSPLLVPLENGLGVGHAQATSLLLIQAVGFSLTQFLCGFTLSRILPYRMVAFSVFTSGLCLMSMAFVTTLTQASIVFLLFGAAAGLYFPAGMATLASLVKPENWGKAVAIHELAPNTSFIILPLLAELALRHTDWRGAFTMLGGALALGGAAFAIWGRGGRSYAAPPSFHGCKELLSDRLTWVFMLLLTIGIAGEFATFSVLPAHLVSEMGFTQERANHVVSLSRILCPLTAILGGWVADRAGPLNTVRAYLVLQGIALWMMSLENVVVAFTGMTAQSLLTAFSFPAIFKMLARSFPPEQQPLLLSLTMPFASFIGTGAVPAFLGFCGQELSFGFGFTIMGVLSAISILSLRNLPERVTHGA